MKSDQALAYSMIRSAALLGERCPVNDVLPGGSNTVGALCRAGLIMVEVSGHNWRRVTLLTGPDSGLTTAADPRGAHIYKTIGVETRITRRQTVIGKPSNPRRIGEFAGG